MTRKDYVLIADALARAKPDVRGPDDAEYGIKCGTWAKTVHHMATALRGTNPRFDTSRFINAANGTPSNWRDRVNS